MPESYGNMNTSNHYIIDHFLDMCMNIVKLSFDFTKTFFLSGCFLNYLLWRGKGVGYTLMRYVYNDFQSEC